MSSCFRVDINYRQTVTFYVEADSRKDIERFLDTNSDWQPGDVEGLIDFVSPQTEIDYSVLIEGLVTPGYRLTGADTLEEIGA